MAAVDFSIGTDHGGRRWSFYVDVARLDNRPIKKFTAQIESYLEFEKLEENCIGHGSWLVPVHCNVHAWSFPDKTIKQTKWSQLSLSKFDKTIKQTKWSKLSLSKFVDSNTFSIEKVAWE